MTRLKALCLCLLLCGLVCCARAETANNDDVERVEAADPAVSPLKDLEEAEREEEEELPFPDEDSEVKKETEKAEEELTSMGYPFSKKGATLTARATKTLPGKGAEPSPEEVPSESAASSETTEPSERTVPAAPTKPIPAKAPQLHHHHHTHHHIHIHHSGADVFRKIEKMLHNPLLQGPGSKASNMLPPLPAAADFSTPPRRAKPMMPPPAKWFCARFDKAGCSMCIRNGCHWCASTRKCHASVNRERKAFGVVATPKCPESNWRYDLLSCHRFRPEAIQPAGVRGCTRMASRNFNPFATKDDGTCVALPQPHKHSGTKRRRKDCVCSQGGFTTPYGRFCGHGYVGGDGQPPCDRVDRCCQLHAWCSLQPHGGADSCRCGCQFKACLSSQRVTSDRGFCYRKAPTLRGLLSELDVIDRVDQRCNRCEHVKPLCNASIHCSGNGQCRLDGSCKCKPGYFPEYATAGARPCSVRCQCGHNSRCVGPEGRCECAPGYEPDDVHPKSCIRTPSKPRKPQSKLAAPLRQMKQGVARIKRIVERPLKRVQNIVVRPLKSAGNMLRTELKNADIKVVQKKGAKKLNKVPQVHEVMKAVGLALIAAIIGFLIWTCCVRPLLEAEADLDSFEYYRPAGATQRGQQQQYSYTPSFAVPDRS